MTFVYRLRLRSGGRKNETKGNRIMLQSMQHKVAAGVVTLGFLALLGASTAQAGCIGRPGDTDDYTLEMRSGEKISIVVAGQWDGLDPVVELRNPRGRIVRENDDAGRTGRIWGRRIEPLDSRIFHYTVRRGGIYIARVRGFSDSVGCYVFAVKAKRGLAQVQGNANLHAATRAGDEYADFDEDGGIYLLVAPNETK